MKLHHYAIDVTDMESSTRFYSRLLNFTDIREEKINGENITFLIKESFIMELVENKDLEQHNEHTHLCFQVKELDTIIDSFGFDGLHPVEGPHMLDNGWKVAFFQGPDKELLEFLELSENRNPAQLYGMV